MIGRTTLGRDELATWQFARLSLGDLFQAVGHVDAVLAPYYLFIHFWTLPGDGTVWLRLPSMVAVAAAAGIAARTTARTWGPVAGVTTGLALALNPTVAALAVEARPYAVALALCTYGTALALEEDLRGRRYVVVMALASLAHLFAVLVVVVHVLVVRRRELVRPAALVGVLAVPMALLARSQRGQVSYIPEPTWTSMRQMIRDVAVPGALLLVVVVAVVLLARAALAGRYREQARTTLLAGIALVVVPAVLLFLASLVLSPVLNGRYLFTAPLGAALLLGATAGLFRGGRWLPLVPAVVVLVVVAPSLGDLHAPRYNGADYPALAKALRAEVKPGDEVRVAIRLSQGGMPAGVARYTGDTAFLDDILDGLPDGEPLLYRRISTGVGQTVAAGPECPTWPRCAATTGSVVWLVAVRGTKPALDAAAALRADGCGVAVVRELSELVLYRAACGNPLGEPTTGGQRQP